jgi:hypothetical protein
MPEFTIYAKIRRIGRRTHKIKNTPVLRLHTWPVDYQDLKTILADAAKEIYFNHDKQTDSEISLDRHLAGMYKMGMVQYRDSRIRVNRIPEFKAKIHFNPKIEDLKISSAAFITPEFFERYKAEYDQDVKRKWKLKPVISPGEIESIFNPDSIYRNLMTIKTPNYDPILIGLYETQQERHHQVGCYDSISHGVYGSSNDNTVEKDKNERQRQH